MTTAIAPVSTAGFIGIAEAMRMTGWTNSKILRHSLIGEVRSLVLPGRYPLFNVADLEALKASYSSPRSAAV